MCFGNDAPQQQHVPSPPPEKEIMDFINHITGTQTVTVTGADGKRKRITTKLPLTPEQEKMVLPARQMVATVLTELPKLFKYNPQSAISFAPVVDTFADLAKETLADIGQFANIGDIEQYKTDFKAMQRAVIDEQFANRNIQNEERLAHSGRGSGTYAAESRAAMARERALAHQIGDTRATQAAEELAAKRLSTNEQAFGLRQQGRQGTLEAVQADYAFNKADEADQEERRLRAIAERERQFGLGSNILRYEEGKALQDRTQDQALSTYLAENNVQNARYGQEVGAIRANNEIAMDEYRNRAPSFGEWAANTAGTIGSAMLTARPDTLAGRLGRKIVG
jgi:hypothetical protein